MPAPEGPRAEPCWVDLLTSDLAGSAHFYAELFGWDVRLEDKPGIEGYAEVYLEGRLITAFVDNEPGSGVGDVWTTYLNVADVHAAAYATRMHGGKVYLKPVEVPGQGTMALIGDPSGTGVGLLQGFAAPQRPATAVHGTRIWSELHTKRFEAVARFYREALGWCINPVSDTDEFRYFTLGQGPDAAAGIHDISGDRQTRAGWRTYFAVRNADDSAALARKLGGRIIEPAHDSYFGRLALLQDVTGAEFAIIAPIQR